MGDGKGMVHYVYFLLSGECRLIEHMLIEKKRVGKKVKYKMIDSSKDEIASRQQIGRARKTAISETINLPDLLMERASEVIYI